MLICKPMNKIFLDIRNITSWHYIEGRVVENNIWKKKSTFDWIFSLMVYIHEGKLLLRDKKAALHH